MLRVYALTHATVKTPFADAVSSGAPDDRVSLQENPIICSFSVTWPGGTKSPTQNSLILGSTWPSD